MEKKIFQVEVIGFNAEAFYTNYSEYIIGVEVDEFDTATFTLEATVSVYEEIDGLKEELINII